MKKAIKIFSVMLIALMLTMTLNTAVFAADDEASSGSSAGSIIDSIDTQAGQSEVDSEKLQVTAGKVLAVIRVAAVIIGVILIAVFGIKFMLGSAAEKAEYQKSFVPLIIGIVVVFGATYIAELLFNTFA